MKERNVFCWSVIRDLTTVGENRTLVWKKITSVPIIKHNLWHLLVQQKSHCWLKRWVNSKLLAVYLEKEKHRLYWFKSASKLKVKSAMIYQKQIIICSWTILNRSNNPSAFIEELQLFLVIIRLLANKLICHFKIDLYT